MDGHTYFERHWRGELSLRLSYWVNHVLVGGIAVKFTSSGISALKREVGEQPLACLCFASVIIIPWLCLQTWQIGGTWRSASRARLAGRSARATLVQLLLCISVLGTIALPFGQLVPMTRAVAAGVPVPIVGTVARQGGTVLDFYGPVDSNSASEFRRVLESSRPVLVRLESGGGLVDQARAIATMIRTRGLDTEVTQSCLSACTIMFFAGRRRLLLGAGVLGFHSYSSMDATPQAILKDEDWERRTYLISGVSPQFVQRIFSVPPARLWYPTREESEAAGFATRSNAR